MCGFVGVKVAGTMVEPTSVTGLALGILFGVILLGLVMLVTGGAIFGV